MARGPLIDWTKHHDTVVKLAPVLNPKRIADQLGIKRNTLNAYMRRKGIDTIQLRTLEGGDHQLIAELYFVHGMGAPEIAEKFGISVYHTYDVIRNTPLDTTPSTH